MKTALWSLMTACMLAVMVLTGCSSGGGGVGETQATGVTLTSIAVTPANPSIARNTNLQCTATGAYSDGTFQNITSSVHWSSGAASVATVNAAGLASGVAAGSATITAASGALSGSTTLFVTAETPTGRFTEPANPLLVSAQSDSAHTATVIVPITGGTVTATGADGSVFTLDIPGDALLTPTEITMTPVSSIADLPLGGGLGAAVKLAPEGLRFYHYATLIITPAQAIPLSQQTFFGFQGNGEDFHLEPPVAGSSALQIKLLHFSGAGVGNGTSADRAAILMHNASDVENRLRQSISEQMRLAREQNAAVDATALFSDTWQEYMDQVVTPRIQAASSSCAAGKSAIQTLLGLERQKQLLGAGPDNALDLMSSLLPQVARACLQEAYDACVNQHDLREIVRLVLGYERQGQLLGSTDTAMPWDALGQQLIKQCLRFELDFASSDGQTGMYEGSVKGTIPLQADLSAFPAAITVKNVPPSPLEVVDLTYLMCPQIGIDITNSGDFTVPDLRFVFGGTDYEKITGVEMDYFPPGIYGMATIQCDSQSSTTIQAPASWEAPYIVLHAYESTGGLGTFLTARDWTIPGGNPIAQKTYNLTGTDSTFDQTTMVLRHTPGP